MKLQEAAVIELRRVFDQYATAANVLDAKALGVLLAASVITGINEVAHQTPLLLVYFAIAAFCLNVIRPRKYRNAIATNWNDLNAYFLQKEEGKAYEILVSTYLAAIEANKRINAEKARYLKISAVLFVVFVAGVIIAAVSLF